MIMYGLYASEFSVSIIIILTQFLSVLPFRVFPLVCRVVAHILGEPVCEQIEQIELEQLSATI